MKLPGRGRIGRSGSAAMLAALPVLLPAAPAIAVEDDGPRPTPTADQRALALLQRASQASRATAYEGVQFVSSWGAGGTDSFLVDVDHLPGYGTAMRVRGTSSAPGGAVFSADSSAGDDAEGSLDGVGIGDATSLGLLERNYVGRVVAIDDVAGRDAAQVEVRRPGMPTPAAVFWIDQATGIILQRRVYDAAGQIVRASAFVSLSVGRSAFLGHLPPLAPQPWSHRIAGAELGRLSAAGWVCPDELADSMIRYDARRVDDDGPILHLSYSDGLSSLSLFEQKGSLDVDRLDGYRVRQIGAVRVHVRDAVPQRIVWSANGIVYTLVADAPAETVHDALQELPHESADAERSGFFARLDRGFSRVASWLNPFR